MLPKSKKKTRICVGNAALKILTFKYFIFQGRKLTAWSRAHGGADRCIPQLLSHSRSGYIIQTRQRGFGMVFDAAAPQ